MAFQSYVDPTTGAVSAIDVGSWSQPSSPNPSPFLNDNTPDYSSPQVLGASTTAPADPYAQFGGTAAYNAQVAGINSQKDNIGTSATDAANTYGSTLGSSILDYVNGAKSTQQNIDNESIQNELSKRQGTAGVLGMVGRGINSAGVMLANKNAGSSSAVDELARAYSELGQRQLSDVGSQYALGSDKIGQEQNTLNTSITSGKDKLLNDKNAHINDIVSTARQNLAALDGQIATASLPDRINLQAEQDKIKQNVINQLQQYDQQITNGAASITPESQSDILSKVGQLAAAGTAPDNPFNFTDTAPATIQGNSPSNFSLPIYTAPRNKQLA